MRQEAFYPHGWLDRFIAKRRYRQVFGWLQRHTGFKTICDVGCGQGMLVQRLINQGHIASGIDVQPGPHIVVSNLNRELPVDSNQFDLVTSLAVLEHLDQPALNLREICRILKPGGTLLLTTPTPLAKPVLELMAFQLHLIDPREIADHKQYFTTSQLRQLLERAGFHHVKTSLFQLGMNTLAIAEK